MRLTFIVIYLGFMVSEEENVLRRPQIKWDKGRKMMVLAKKSRSTSEEDSYYYSYESSESYESYESYEYIDRTPVGGGYFNFEGSIRREFALEAALAAHAANMICSPVSVMMPLGKLALGAGRRTGKELTKALHLSRSEQIIRTFKQIITSLEYLPGVTLDMANKIYVSTENNINIMFAKYAELVFKSSVEKIRASYPKETANTINRWVAKKTSNKITELIYSKDIAEDTSLILVNAIYFAGKWLNKFDKTFTDDFFSPAGRRRILMMSRQGTYNYWKCDTLNAEIVEIPYAGSKSAMIVVLPYSDKKLRYLLQKLKSTPDLLNIALKKMKKTDIKLTMPKFKIETVLDLKKILKAVGLKTIFNARYSDLNRIIDDETVFVTDAVHKAVIEVTELGTEAAAASAYEFQALSASINYPTMKMNRPFLFYISAYQEQLFAGIFTGNT